MAKNIEFTFSIRIYEEGQTTFLTVDGPGKVKVDRQEFILSFSKEQLEILNALKTKPRIVPIQDLIEIGRVMYAAIFTIPVERAFGTLESQLAYDSGFRIRLIIEPKELVSLPWELMHDGRDFIVLHSNFPIVRGINPAQDIRFTPVRGVLKILYVWANPNDLPELKVEKSATEIKGLLSGNKSIQFEVLPHATFESLQSALLKDYHIICFAGHGSEAAIYLEKDISHQKISAAAFDRALEGKNSIRLLYFAACKTADMTLQELSGFAHTLASKSKLPAIVAMQYEIYDKEANIFLARFFETLSSLRPVDVALSEARKSVVDEFKTVRDVFAPIMYLQSKSSSLFRRTSNWPAIVFATAFLITTVIGMIFWNRAMGAQANAAAEATKRAEAQATAIIESTERAKAQATAEFLDAIALSRKLSAEAVAQLNENPDLALLLSVEAFHASDTLEAKRSLLLNLERNSNIKTILQGHSTSVECLTFSPNGKWLASGDASGNIYLWNLSGNPPDRFVLRRHIHEVTALVFGDENRTILSGDIDGNIFLWNIDEKKVASQWFSATPIDSINFLDKESFVTISSNTKGNLVQVWSIKEGNPRKEFLLSSGKAALGNGFVYSLSLEFPDFVFERADLETGEAEKLVNNTSIPYEYLPVYTLSTDEQILVTGGCNHGTGATSPCLQGRIDIWDVTSGTVTESKLVNHTDTISALVLSSDNKILASAGGGETHSDNNPSSIYIWDTSTRQIIAGPMTGHAGAITNLVFSSDGKVLASADSSGIVILWNVFPQGYYEEGLKISNTRIINTDKLFVRSCYPIRNACKYVIWDTTAKKAVYTIEYLEPKDLGSFEPFTQAEENTLSIEDQGATLFIKDNIRELVLASFPRQDDPLYVNVSPAGDILEIIQGTNSFFWNWKNQQQIEIDFSRNLLTLSTSPDGRFILASYPNEIRVWDITQNQPTSRYTIPLKSNIDAKITFSKGGRILIIEDVNSYSLLDFETNQSIAEFEKKRYYSLNLEFSKNDRYLLLKYRSTRSGYNDYIQLFDIENNSFIQYEIEANYSFISDDGTRVVTTESENQNSTLSIWDTRTGMQISQWPLPPFSSNPIVAISSDNRYLAMSSGHDNIYIWDLDSNQSSLEITIKGEVDTLNFDPYRNLLLSTGCSNLRYHLFDNCYFGLINTWSMDSNLLSQIACQVAGRNLTFEEWNNFLPDKEYQKSCAQYP